MSCCLPALKHLTVSINQCLCDGGVWRGRLLPPLRQSTSLHLRELQAAIDDYRALSPAARYITRQRNYSHLRHIQNKAIAPLPHSYNPTWLTTRLPLSWTSQYYTTCQSAWTFMANQHSTQRYGLLQTWFRRQRLSLLRLSYRHRNQRSCRRRRRIGLWPPSCCEQAHFLDRRRWRTLVRKERN